MGSARSRLACEGTLWERRLRGWSPPSLFLHASPVDDLSLSLSGFLVPLMGVVVFDGGVC